MCTHYSNEQEWLRALQKQEEKAIACLYKEPYLKAFGQLINRNVPHQDVEDLLQNAMIAFLAAIQKPGFKLTQSISTYFCGIARNVAFNYFREKRKFDMDSDGENKMTKLADELEGDTEEYLQNRWKEIEPYFKRLDSKIQALIRARKVKVKSWREIVKNFHPELFDPDQEEAITRRERAFAQSVSAGLQRVKEWWKQANRGGA